MAAIMGPMRPYDNNLTFAITSMTVVDLGHLHGRMLRIHWFQWGLCFTRKNAKWHVVMRLTLLKSVVPIHCNSLV